MNAHATLKKRYKRLKSTASESITDRYKPVFRQLEYEVGTWSTWYSMPVQKRFWLLKNGFLSPAWELYDLPANSDEYLSYRDRLKADGINRPWHEILNNKHIFHRELSDFGHLRPDLYAVIHRDEITPVDADVDANIDPGEWVLEQVREKGRLVLKPVKGSTGTGIHFVESTDRHGEVCIDDDRVTTDEAIDFVRSLEDYVVTDHITQHECLEEIYPHSLNTMRILTMWDADAEETFIAGAILRIGTEQSRPVDNFTKGGLSADIDVESGELGPAAKLESGKLRRYDDHPDTGTAIAGRRMDEWEVVRETILEVAESISLPEYVGWDVTVAADGSPRIIEGNNNSDLDVLQVHEPILRDDRVRRFYERHGVI